MGKGWYKVANITKNQIKRRVEKLISSLEDIKEEVANLQFEVEDESQNVEPYEGKDDLTPQQEERQEWLDDSASILDDQIYELETIIEALEDITLE